MNTAETEAKPIKQKDKAELVGLAIEATNRVTCRLQELLNRITNSPAPPAEGLDPIVTLNDLLENGPSRLGNYTNESHRLLDAISESLF